ncbi:MAG TPA: ABC transporter ATP-binding protein [Myxococcales bacterium]|nr:ABC transporter ATP-binding protein [Myxococcales bacterium]
MKALELSGIVKRFGGVAAVDGVSLEVAPGEVLALVGENGAGKSTLISVACGLYAADAGTVRAFGQDLPAGNPRFAIDAGIGVVYQHFMLVGPLRVWENVVLGREPRLLGFIDRRRARREVAQAAERFGLSLDVDAEVESLGVAAQQRVEIVKQLWRGAKVLILDEPTAVLSPREADDLVRTSRALAADGRAVIFISHKLREVLAVADRIAVLRRGKLVQVTPRGQTDAGQLAEAVMGAPREAATADDAAYIGAPRPRPARSAPRESDTLLQVRDLSCQSSRGRPALRGLSFHIAAGEILGVAGVDGNGQAELAEVLTGLRDASGGLSLAGDAAFFHTPASARGAGVAHLPEDRHRRALCLPLSVEENLALGHHRRPPYSRGLRIDVEGRRQKARDLISAFDVRPQDPLARTADLSGGNQQKLVAARELLGGAPPRLVVAVHPTRGLDIGATRRVHGALRAARDAGAAVLVVSLDLDELRAVSDRILVLFDGAATGEVPPDTSDDVLGRMMLGQEAARA